MVQGRACATAVLPALDALRPELLLRLVHRCPRHRELRERAARVRNAIRRTDTLFEGIAEDMDAEEIALMKSTPRCQMPT
jgi:hypothetical protein